MTANSLPTVPITNLVENVSEMELADNAYYILYLYTMQHHDTAAI